MTCLILRFFASSQLYSSPAAPPPVARPLPIREPIAHYGPFVMNTREEILQAVDDFNAGRMGTIPAVGLS